MIRLFKYLTLLRLKLIIFITFISCKKDPSPIKADFEVNKRVVEVNESVKFTSTSLNGATFDWDFGNGQTSKKDQDSATYNAPGTYKVTLRAFNEIKEYNEKTKEITVGKCFLRKVMLSRFNFTDQNGNPWDIADGSDPDVEISFNPKSDSTRNGVYFLGSNFSQRKIPFTIDSFSPILLKNEDWIVKVIETGHLGSGQDRLIKRWIFNPLIEINKSQYNSIILSGPYPEVVLYIDVK